MVDVPPGETLSIPEDAEYWADPLDVGGTVDVAGTLTVEPSVPLSASGTADTGGTAILSAELSLTASGAGETLGTAALSTELGLSASAVADTTGTASLSRELQLRALGGSTIYEGETVTIPTSETERADPVTVSGTLDIFGTLSLDPYAGGIADSEGTAALSLIFPLVRDDDRTVSWNETDNRTLAAENP